MYQIKSCLDFPTPGAPLTLMEGLGGGGGGPIDFFRFETLAKRDFWGL